MRRKSAKKEIEIAQVAKKVSIFGFGDFVEEKIRVWFKSWFQVRRQGMNRCSFHEIKRKQQEEKSERIRWVNQFSMQSCKRNAEESWW